MGKREQKINIIKEYLPYCSSVFSCYVYGAIPKSKVENACMTYAAKVEYDDVIGLIDETVFGNGKSGILFTIDGFIDSKDARFYSYKEGIQYKQLPSAYNLVNVNKILSRMCEIENQPSGWEIAGAVLGGALDIAKEISSAHNGGETVRGEKKYSKEIWDTVDWVKSGERKKVYSKEIYIYADQNCEGDMQFDECKIHYNADGNNGQIIVLKSGNIKFTNCIIECEGYDTCAFIDCDDDNICNHIIFEECTFINCTELLENETVIELQLKKCVFVNCYKECINISLLPKAICKVSDCIIVGNAIAEFNKPLVDNKQVFDQALILIQLAEDCYCIIENTTIVVSDNHPDTNNAWPMRYFFFYGYQGNREIRDCTFYGVSNIVWGACNIERCIFKKCKPVIDGETKIIELKECIFEECTRVVYPLSSPMLVFNRCQFLKCFDEVCHGKINFVNCQFSQLEHRNYRTKEQTTLGFEGGEKRSPLIVEKCAFSGLKMGQGYLMKELWNEKKNQYGVTVVDCSFSDWSTEDKNNKIIIPEFYHSSLFSYKKYCAFVFRNCRGLFDTGNEERQMGSGMIENVSREDIGATIKVELPDAVKWILTYIK